MKRQIIFECFLATILTLSSIEAYAYGDDKEKEVCRHPKVQEFTLPEYQPPENKEVPAQAEFSFIVSGWADPKKIKVDGKGVSVPITVENKDTFHKVKGKLPAELTGKVVRLNARIPALLGCYTTIGWLIKVADNKAGATPAVTTPEKASAATGGEATSANPSAPAKVEQPASATQPTDKVAPTP